MKKRNVILHTAIASALLAMGVAAQAGTLTTTTKVFATQNFGSTTTATTEIVPGAVTYTYSTPGGIVLNNGGVINAYFRLNNGATFTAIPTTADFSGTVATGLLLTKTSVALSTDKTTLVLTLTNATGANVTIGVGATIVFTPAATRAVANVNTVLNTAGNSVTMTASNSVLAALSGAGMNATVALPADIDGAAATAVSIASAASGIGATVTAPAATETQKIDVTAATSQTLMTTGVATASTSLVNLGSFTFTDSTTAAMQLNGTTTYSVANNGGATGVGAVVTGNFGSAATTGAVVTGVTLSSTANCATPLVAGAVASVNTAKTVATFTGGTKQASAAPIYVCMLVNGTAVIPTTNPTITTSLTPTAGAAEVAIAGSGTLYNLTLNGASVDVRSYIPAAATGYATYLRVINTGTSSAPISVAVIDPTTGVAGASSVLGTLAAGAAKTYLASDVETALGTSLAATLRPRIRVSGPTSSLQVQSFMSSPSGVFSDMTGAQ